jgi:AbrB family looped-hinge helix DNA binding protein
MRITSRGQITIPKEIREQAGLLPNTEVEFICDGESVQIIRSDLKQMSHGARLVAHMRGRGSGTFSTKDIMALTRRR